MPNWRETIGRESDGLLPGATASIIAGVEADIGLRLPASYKEFLAFADGGYLDSKTILLFAAGKGIHPSETLVASNRSLPVEHPLFIIGRTASEDFGFMKSDLQLSSPAVYIYRHEIRRLTKIADSFEDFLHQPRQLDQRSRSN